ncbi:GNAT family acetyltransferase [Mesobacillus foraminis]|uniref:Acetyltransferase (GNAT) family protein n=1 Tax=Mesobacillus foraminis TaxID=279826 RepID=A0A4R2BHJ8_9BACI|nr:GNAT family acetyltransferase [Mesobacillus foraminis]TCN25499.1 hypothetical protein EV146_105156 [Mesobacillus foraminis]
MQITSLQSLIEISKQDEEVTEYLSSFSTKNNEDVENFLKNNAIPNEKRSLTRTFLVVDDENDNEIVGYFTILVKPFDIIEGVSQGLRKRLTENKKATVFNSILIAQLGRSDSYKGLVPGDIILQFALENCKLIYDLSGLRIVCVEYDDNPFLNDFYLKNDFKILQLNDNGKLLAYIRF